MSYWVKMESTVGGKGQQKVVQKFESDKTLSNIQQCKREEKVVHYKWNDEHKEEDKMETLNGK